MFYSLYPYDSSIAAFIECIPFISFFPSSFFLFYQRSASVD